MSLLIFFSCTNSSLSVCVTETSSFLFFRKVETAKDIQSLLECGLDRRAKMSTKVHDHSSRSHLIVSVTATFFRGNDDCRSDSGTPRKRPQSALECHDFDSFGNILLCAFDLLLFYL